MAHVSKDRDEPARYHVDWPPRRPTEEFLEDLDWFRTARLLCLPWAERDWLAEEVEIGVVASNNDKVLTKYEV